MTSKNILIESCGLGIDPTAAAAAAAVDSKRKGGRKQKKPNHKELLNMYYVDNRTALEEAKEREKEEKEKEKKKKDFQKPLFENIQHLSGYERGQLEKKFTKPKNRHQENYVAMLQNPLKKIVIVTGPAGTGKTMFATQFAVRSFLQGVHEKLVFTRPSVSVDEDLGYLPGTLEEKMAPWIRPIYDVLYDFISPKEVQAYIEDKVIEIAPLGFMRGRTFKNTWIVADEMQNSSISQMKMLMTRLGKGSRLIITGDLEQYDRPAEVNGMEDFLTKFKGKRSSSIESFEFDRNDIQREQVVKEVLDIYAGSSIPPDYVEDTEDLLFNNDLSLVLR
jgi:phosphate starvation-inducible PhoH-like protein